MPYEGVEIDACTQCGGEWLDADELKAIVDRREKQWDPTDLAAMPRSPEVTMPQTSPYAAVLTELEPVVAENLDRHLKMAKEWHPHDYVPWDEGRNFAFLGGEDWSPEQSRLDDTAKAAIVRGSALRSCRTMQAAAGSSSRASWIAQPTDHWSPANA